MIVIQVSSAIKGFASTAALVKDTMKCGFYVFIFYTAVGVQAKSPVIP